MDSNLKGNIGEAKALDYFISNGYDVYTPFGTASKCDMIIVKGDEIKRVSVKSSSSITRSGKLRVRIRQGKLNKQEPFNKNNSDVLFIYSFVDNKFYIFESKNIDKKFEFCINIDQ